MSEQEQQMEQIEVSIEQAKAQTAKVVALDRLHKNPDFKLVILEGYFKDEASRIVGFKADPSVQGEEQQAMADRIICSIGGLRQYFATIFALGYQAEMALSEDELTREQMLQEQLGDGDIDTGGLQ